MTSSMDEHVMATGVVPVRPPSYLIRMVKLPRRFEKAALGDPKTSRHRKVSLCGTPLHMRQSISDRIEDLVTANMWVKQELICLRQHDILLKRQFFDIIDSIQAIRNQENSTTSSSLSSSPSSSISTSTKAKSPDSSGQNDHSNSITASSRLASASPSMSLSTSPSPTQSPLTFNKKRQPNGISNLFSSQFFLMDAATIRASSATVLNHNDENSDESEDDDTFDCNFFRPRTSSMKTSRDLAALARRRGSKDLV